MGRCSEILSSPVLPVTVCLFMWAASHVGVMKVIGIYLEDISIDLATTSTDIGVALGLLNAFCFFPSPIIAALYRHQSTRRLLLLSGACILPVGVALTSMATSNSQMAIYLSVTGLGLSILMVCCTVTLHRLAKENYNLCFSLALTGYGPGMVILPLVAEFLRKTYSWRGGLLIISALMAHIIPCAFGIKSESNERSTEENGFQPISSQSTLGESDGEESRRSTCHYAKGDDCNQYGYFHRIISSLRRSDFYMDPMINVVCGMNGAFGIVYSCWHAFLVPHVLQRGFSVRNTIILTFSAAIGNTVGRGSVAFLTNNAFHPVTVYIFATIMDIPALLVDVYFVNYYTMLLTSCITAMSVGARAVLGVLVLRNRASPEKFDVAFAVDEVFIGAGAFLGGYLGGVMADQFSTYNATFMMLPIIDVAMLVLIMIIRWNPKVNCE